MLETTRVEIPEISDKKLGYLARKIRPVVSCEELPLGRWPRDNVRVHFLRLPRNLRGFNFLKEPRAKQCTFPLTQIGYIFTLHTPGSMGRVFHPTIAEVLAQIENENLGSRDRDWRKQIIAFETFLEEYDVRYDESGRFHIAKTVLLGKGFPRNGNLQRLHYS